MVHGRDASPSMMAIQGETPECGGRMAKERMVRDRASGASGTAWGLAGSAGLQTGSGASKARLRTGSRVVRLGLSLDRSTGRAHPVQVEVGRHPPTLARGE